MLPFTKRPGKDESADVVTKESAPERPRTVPPAAKSSPSADRPRLAMPSISDEEMTCLMPSKALTGAVPLPAAGKPASKTVPPATAASKSVPTGKKRVAKKPQPIDDEEDHRTVVRPGLSSHGISLPKSAAQLGGSTESASPAAVIKAHLEAARAAAATGSHQAVSATQSGAHGALPVQDDVSSFPGVEIGGGSRPGVDHDDDRPERTVALPPSMNMTPAPGVPSVQQQISSHGVPHPMQSQPHMHQPAHYSQVPPAMQSAPAMQPFVRQAAVPQPMASQPMMMGQPAHFAPQPMSSPHMDPPATVVTSSTRKPRGNRTVGWAAALMSVGLLVGLAAAAVATGRADGLVDTTASFVDPSRAGAPKAAAAPKETPKDLAKDPSAKDPNAAPIAQPTPPSSGVVNTGDPVTVAATPVVDPATTAAPPTTPPATDPAATGAPPAATTAAPPATVAATAAAPPQPPATVAAVTPPPKPATPVKTAAAPAAPPPAAAPAPKPEPKPAVAAKPTPAPTPAAKPKGSSEDDEMKKAAEALAKAQLENSL